LCTSIPTYSFLEIDFRFMACLLCSG